MACRRRALEIQAVAANQQPREHAHQEAEILNRRRQREETKKPPVRGSAAKAMREDAAVTP